MELFKKKISPVFLKETSDATQLKGQLEALLPQASGDTRDEIENK